MPLPAQVVDATQALNRSAGVANPESLAWSFVELPSHFVELGLRVHGQVSPLRQVLPKQTVGVFIGTTLPRTLRIAEVNVDVGRQRQAPMVRKLLAAVPGQRLIQLIRYRLRLLDQRGNYGLGILVGDLRQCHVTRLPFDQGRDVAVLRSGQQIAFPMPGSARERFARPRAGAASRSAIRIASGCAPR